MWDPVNRYHVVFSEKARSEFMELRRSSACILVSWIGEYLEGCKNPRARGRSLTGEVSRWRYHVGKYRLLAEIEKDRIVILSVCYDLERSGK